MEEGAEEQGQEQRRRAIEEEAEDRGGACECEGEASKRGERGDEGDQCCRRSIGENRQ